MRLIASLKQFSDTHKTPYDRVKRCWERKINIKAFKRVNRIAKEGPTAISPSTNRQSRTAVFKQRTDIGHCKAGPDIFFHIRPAAREDHNMGVSVHHFVLPATSFASDGRTRRQQPDALIVSLPRVQTHLLPQEGQAALQVDLIIDDSAYLFLFTARLRNEGAGKREIPRKPADQRHPSAAIPTCNNLGATPPGIELGSPWWEVSSPTTTPPWPPTAGGSGSIYSHIRNEADVTVHQLVVSRCFPFHHKLCSPPVYRSRRGVVVRLLACLRKVYRVRFTAGLHPTHGGVASNPRRGCIQYFARGNRVGRCCWSTGFLGDIPLPRPCVPALLHSYLASPSSALKITMAAKNLLVSTRLGASSFLSWPATREDRAEWVCPIADSRPPEPASGIMFKANGARNHVTGRASPQQRAVDPSSRGRYEPVIPLEKNGGGGGSVLIREAVLRSPFAVYVVWITRSLMDITASHRSRTACGLSCVCACERPAVHHIALPCSTSTLTPAPL
ncbi:hypothetical protein PR048_021372 [Dryococelus australis]|uniref:Uncharacterized protein n=1 Tax=Dryococelus australis TaxID=614101 RepID=A0ABQ9GY37_9NEOP|nr:hypothetical protein PR048_021372 [Dryococelus australis]